MVSGMSDFYSFGGKPEALYVLECDVSASFSRGSLLYFNMSQLPHGHLR